MNTMTEDKYEYYSNSGNVAVGLGIGYIIFIFLWLIAGLVAFIMSLVCFGKSGTTTDKFIGLILAFLFGPLYFIFFGLNKSYCR
jgi:uncharacterized RDD family membrane protein YckC